MKRSGMLCSQLSFAILACSLWACSEADVGSNEPEEERVHCNKAGMCSDPNQKCVDGYCVDAGNHEPGNQEPGGDPGHGDPGNPPGGGASGDPNLKDTDGDTIPDKWDRCDVDTDGDQIPDCEDLDSDGDTIADALEAGNIALNGEPVFVNGAENYAFLTKDADANGIPDNLECIWGVNTLDTPEVLTTSCSDTDGDGEPDFMDPDNDGDDLPDVLEIFGGTVGTTPAGKAAADCDHDGQPDPLGSLTAPFVCKGKPAFINPDSDGDSVPDLYESTLDSNDDGFLDVYSLDSDGDTIPDREEKCGPNAVCEVPYSGKNGIFYFQSTDGDGDTIPDNMEVDCSAWGLPNARYSDDVDGDGYKDVSEYYAAFASGRYSARQMICDATITVKSIYEFYFELPEKGSAQEDTLYFAPTVSRLDLVFNVDTTASMSGAINSVKTNIGSIIAKMRSMVEDTGIALTNFDDLTGNMCRYAEPGIVNPTIMACGLYSKGDRPFRVLGGISTKDQTITSYTQNDLFVTRSGEDFPEAGVESLYQIVTGEGLTWYDGTIKRSIDKHMNSGDTWGAVDFRKNALPVIIHITDVPSHDKSSSYYSIDSIFNYTECGSSKKDCVISPHYTEALMPVVRENGVRIITLGVGAKHKEELVQMNTWARESNAVVPACAFKTAENTWDCNGDHSANKCCLGNEVSDSVTINGKSDQCVLSFMGNQSSVAEYMSQGVEALVKYGTYEVSTEVVGEPIPGKTYGTECFIKKIEAYNYIPPAEEPEKSCNPVAEPYATTASKGYKDGFRNFATGTANADSKGARLTFRVVAENDHCVEETDKAQLFEAKIRVINPTTGLVFDMQEVSILVPPRNIVSIL